MWDWVSFSIRIQILDLDFLEIFFCTLFYILETNPFLKNLYYDICMRCAFVYVCLNWLTQSSFNSRRRKVFYGNPFNFYSVYDPIWSIFSVYTILWIYVIYISSELLVIVHLLSVLKFYLFYKLMCKVVFIAQWNLCTWILFYVVKLLKKYINGILCC